MEIGFFSMSHRTCLGSVYGFSGMEVPVGFCRFLIVCNASNLNFIEGARGLRLNLFGGFKGQPPGNYS